MSPVNTNVGEYKSKIGLDNLYIAVVNTDDSTTFAADTPEYLAPAAEASQEPSGSFEIQYADDQPYDVMSSEGETKITLDVTGMGLEMLAKITGRRFDAATGRMFDNAGVAPYVALSFRSQKSNGGYRYYQYLKGKFDMPKEETATKGEKPEPKTLKLTYTAIKTVKKWDLGGGVTDSVKRIVGDDDTTNFSDTGWFSQVQTPSTTTPSALALSAGDPTGGATGVAVTKTITLTFNNELASDAIYNVTLINSSTGAVVAGTNTLDVTRKIITVGHSSNLAASTLHRAIYAGVTDIYGQTLTGVLSFTTA